MKGRLLILFWLTGSSLLAQENSLFIALSGGAGIPTRYFRSTTVTPVGIGNGIWASPGYALTGWNADIALVYRPKNFFAFFTALVRNQNNTMNRQSLGSNHGNNLQVTTGSWNTLSYLFGLTKIGFTSEDEGSTHAYLRLLLGPSRCHLPATNVTGIYNNQPYQHFQRSANVYAMAYLLGLGAKIPVSKHIGVIMNFDYFVTRAEFKKVTTVHNGSIYSENTIKQDITVFSVGAGLVLAL